MAGPAIREHRYDENRNELTIIFSTGRGYVYSLIPPHVAAAFSGAPSKGGFHNAHIKDRYPFRKIEAAVQRIARAPSLREALLRSADEA